MRSMLMTVLFSLLLAGPALAVEEPADYPLSGLEFGLPSNLGLDDFGLRVVDGYDFSWTRRTSPSRGWRVGTSVYFDHDGDVDNNGDEGPGYWYFSSQESDRDLVRVSLRVQKLFVSEPRHGVSFVLGVGPGRGFRAEFQRAIASRGNTFRRTRRTMIFRIRSSVRTSRTGAGSGPERPGTPESSGAFLASSPSAPATSGR